METALTLLSYPISWLELIGTLTGLASVWLAVKNNLLTWPIGLINVICFGFLFYQYRLYSDTLLLQLYFFAMSLYGWWQWRGSGAEETPITTLTAKNRAYWVGGILALTLVQGYWVSNAHTWLPRFFPEPAAFPYPDAFTTVASIVATYLLARRKLETWVLWVLVDIISIVLYFSKGILLVGIEYIVFLVLASLGGYRWYKSLRHA